MAKNGTSLASAKKMASDYERARKAMLAALARAKASEDDPAGVTTQFLRQQVWRKRVV